MLPYRKIEAWKLADDGAVNMYRLTRTFPSEERFGLSSQLRRAAVSVATNIVEGSRRLTIRDSAHFLNMAEGSAAEVGYLLSICTRIGIASDESVLPLIALYDRIAAMLYSLRLKLH
jgi:four helix bundle protein